MFSKHVAAVTGAFALVVASGANAAVLMAPDWAKQACDAWNQNKVLTEELAASGWSKNDKGRGYKLIRLYRQDCERSPQIELRIADKDGKAMCIDGGTASDAPLVANADYLMWAPTERWLQMGKGEYGPMRAMMFGRLKFEGPMWEAMNNMGPFEQFLRLVGTVSSDSSACPNSSATTAR